MQQQQVLSGLGLYQIVVRVVFSVGLGAEAGIVVRTSVGFGAGGGWGLGLH